MARCTVAIAILAFAATASAQEVKPYKEGPVTSLSYIRTKPGKFDEYMKFLDTGYKSLMEANKKAGLIIGYAVYAASPRSPREPDIILSVSYANWGALDKVDEAEAVASKVMGPSSAQSKGAIDREALRSRSIARRCARSWAAK